MLDFTQESTFIESQELGTQVSFRVSPFDKQSGNTKSSPIEQVHAKK